MKQPKRKKYKIKLEDLSAKHQAEARAQLGKPKEREPFDTVQARIMAPARGKAAFPLAKIQPPKPKRKQAGKDETQVHRDVREMIANAWDSAEVTEERPMQLTDEHTYTADFFVKADGQEIVIEAKGPFTREDSRYKFIAAEIRYRWRFFIWAKQHRKKNWTFEVRHACGRLKLTGKYQNPKSMAECAELIKSTVEERDGE